MSPDTGLFVDESGLVGLSITLSGSPAEDVTVTVTLEQPWQGEVGVPSQVVVAGASEGDLTLEFVITAEDDSFDEGEFSQTAVLVSVSSSQVRSIDPVLCDAPACMFMYLAFLSLQGRGGEGLVHVSTPIFTPGS